jgi:hypothetical protein
MQAGDGAMKREARSGAAAVPGRCLCGAVRFEIDYPAFWAWHDHGRASRIAHGAACATYVGTWRKRYRVTEGADAITRYEDKQDGSARSFCSRCGTPLLYERSGPRRMINIPRALFESRTGRQPLYHIRFDERPEWAYREQPLAPLKGYPGVVWERPRRKRRTAGERL